MRDESAANDTPGYIGVFGNKSILLDNNNNNNSNNNKILLLFAVTSVQGIYNYIPETNNVSRVYSDHVISGSL
jgi:hypothetical protein